MSSKAAAVTTTAAIWNLQAPSVLAAESTSDLVAEIQDIKSKIEPIPSLLEAQEWDKVRTILKTPPVNKVWNLGDSQNTILKLARETGNVELLELHDELSISLQECDQLTYNNVFVYFQPGSGKINIKEPQDMAKKSISLLQQVLSEASN